MIQHISQRIHPLLSERRYFQRSLQILDLSLPCDIASPKQLEAIERLFDMASLLPNLRELEVLLRWGDSFQPSPPPLPSSPSSPKDKNTPSKVRIVQLFSLDSCSASLATPFPRLEKMSLWASKHGPPNSSIQFELSDTFYDLFLTKTAALKEFEIGGFHLESDPAGDASLVWKSFLANSQVRLQSFNLPNYPEDKTYSKMKEKFPSLWEERSYSPEESLENWKEYFSPPLCDERELTYLWTIREFDWCLGDLHTDADDYHNKVFNYFEKQLFLEDVEFANIPFTLDKVNRGNRLQCSRCVMDHLTQTHSTEYRREELFESKKG